MIWIEVKHQLGKNPFLNNVGLFLSAIKNILDNFKRKIFPIKNLDKIPAPESTSEPTVFDNKYKKYIFREYFEYYNPSFLVRFI